MSVELSLHRHFHLFALEAVWSSFVPYPVENLMPRLCDKNDSMSRIGEAWMMDIKLIIRERFMLRGCLFRCY